MGDFGGPARVARPPRASHLKAPTAGEVEHPSTEFESRVFQQTL